jgi:hypothetical protein
MAEPMSPIQRLAKLSATPVPRKMVPVVKPVKVTGKTTAEDDPWGVLGSTTTTPASTSPGGQNFVGPTLDPTVIQKRSELTAQQQQALKAGVPPAVVESIATGKGDPNRGFLGPAKWLGNVIKNVYDVDVVPGKGSFQPLVKATNLDIIPGSKEFKPIKATGKLAGTVGTKALVAASPALDKLDFGRRFVTSTLKEIGDEVAVWRGTRERGKAGQGEFRGKGGFSVDDWWKQLSKEGGIGGGEAFADIKNPYVNQLLGFAADVFLDPTTYVTGPGGIGKTAIERGVITGATEQGARVAARAAAAEADNFAAALARKVAEDALDDAIRIGDNAAAAAAEDAIALANKKAADAAKKLAGDAAGRTMGRTSNQALAERVLGMRDEAQKVVDLGTAPADELAYAQRAVEVLNDEVIANIQKSGLAGIAGPLKDIVRGVRTPAQDILGVRGGLRITNPLAVSYGPSGISKPESSRKSSTEISPSTSKSSVWDCVGKSSLYSSYSSLISPMRDSTRSSRVTIPSVPPYSSKTTAIWLRLLRISASAGNTPFVPGRLSTGRTNSKIVAPVVECTFGFNRSRTCRKPITSSVLPLVTGYLECESLTATAIASLIDRPTSMKSTSVLGTIISCNCKSPAANTSSTISRSSSLSEVCPETKSTNSASEISLRASFAFSPKSFTTASVDLDNNQIIGRKIFAIKSIVGAAASAIISVR